MPAKRSLATLLDWVCDPELEDWHALWLAAAEGRALTAVGTGVEERSFFMALLRVCYAAARVRLTAGLLCSAPMHRRAHLLPHIDVLPCSACDLVCAFAAEPWDVFDWACQATAAFEFRLFGGLARRWSEIRLKPTAGASDAARAHAREKLACYRLTGALDVDYWPFQLPGGDDTGDGDSDSSSSGGGVVVGVGGELGVD